VELVRDLKDEALASCHHPREGHPLSLYDHHHHCRRHPFSRRIRAESMPWRKVLVEAIQRRSFIVEMMRIHSQDQVGEVVVVVLVL
jgi:hypothetical protein